VNLGRIQKAIDDKKLDAGAKITEETLRKAGLIGAGRDGVRLLADGQLKAKLDIEVAGASKSARDAVEKAGGTLTTTFVKKVWKNKKGEPGKRQTRRTQSAEKRAARRGQ
jgi:large subunit ribosomal protein L15